MKTIVFDARMYGLEHAGIGRYIQNLLLAIGEIKPHFRFRILAAEEKEEKLRKKLGSFYSYHPLKSSHYSLGEQVEVRRIIKKLQPDLVHFPHFNAPVFYSGRYVVTIHDLIKHFYKGRATTTKSALAYWPKYFGYRLVVRKVVKGARAIIVPTFWWKEKLAKIYKISKNKIFATWEGIDESFLEKESFLPEKRKEILKKYHLENKDYFIYTGSLYPHKNVERLIKALGAIENKNYYLAVVCSRDFFGRRLRKMVKKLKMESRVKFLGFVPDLELKILYSKSLALVQPSLMEGFGLTGLEAMASNCPVASSSGSCLPEVYGQAAIYFNPLKEEEISQTLLKIGTNQDLRKKLISLGRRRLALFSWKKMAQQTIEIYQKSA